MNEATARRVMAASHRHCDTCGFTHSQQDPACPKTVMYQVTSTKPGEPTLIVAEFDNGYDARQFAIKHHATRAARGKVITIKRSDGKDI